VVAVSFINADMAAHILNIAEYDESVKGALDTYKLKLREAIYKYLKGE